MTDMTPFDTDRGAIARYLGLNPSDPKSHAAVAVCSRYGLDPVLKHVIVLPKGGVYITRDGLLHLAHQSGQLDGIVVEDQGEDDTEWWARVSIYRRDMRFPFTYRGRYSKGGSNRAYGPEMALKCAEALGLRRAFDVSGLPILEERDAAPQTPPVVNTARLVPQVPIPEPEVRDLGPVEVVDAEVVEIDEPITGGQLRKLSTMFEQLDVSRDDRLALVNEHLADVGQSAVESSKQLTKRQASALIDWLEETYMPGAEGDSE